MTFPTMYSLFALHKTTHHFFALHNEMVAFSIRTLKLLCFGKSSSRDLWPKMLTIYSIKCILRCLCLQAVFTQAVFTQSIRPGEKVEQSRVWFLCKDSLNRRLPLDDEDDRENTIVSIIEGIFIDATPFYISEHLNIFSNFCIIIIQYAYK